MELFRTSVATDLTGSDVQAVQDDDKKVIACKKKQSSSMLSVILKLTVSSASIKIRKNQQNCFRESFIS